MLYIAGGIGLWAVVVLSTWWAVHIETSRMMRRVRRMAAEIDAVAANVAEVRWLLESDESDDGEGVQPAPVAVEPSAEKRESFGW